MQQSEKRVKNAIKYIQMLYKAKEKPVKLYGDYSTIVDEAKYALFKE